MTVEETELAQIDQELAARIDPWLAHMRWRPNFDNWRQARLHQEDHQKEALRLLEQGWRVTAWNREPNRLRPKLWPTRSA